MVTREAVEESQAILLPVELGLNQLEYRERRAATLDCTRPDRAGSLSQSQYHIMSHKHGEELSK